MISTSPIHTQKSFVVTWLLSLFLGLFGADRFYLGKIGTGILKLVTFGGLGIWFLVDLFFTLAGVQKDEFGRPLEGYDEYRKTAWIVTGVVFLLGWVGNILAPKCEHDAPAPPPPPPVGLEVEVEELEHLPEEET